MVETSSISVGQRVMDWVEQCRSSIRKMNHNVYLVLLFVTFNVAGDSIMLRQLMSGFLFIIGSGSNTLVGVASGCAGLANVLSAAPAGYYGDVMRRDTIFKVAGGVGVLGCILTFVTVLVVQPLDIFSNPDHDSLGETHTDKEEDDVGTFYALSVCVQDACILILIMQSVWGIWSGLTNPTLESIFADSVETGARAEIYTVKYSITMVAASVGPFVASLFLIYLGDEWELSILRPVILSGLLLRCVAITVCGFFDDDKSLGTRSEADVGQLLEAQYKPLCEGVDAEDGVEERLGHEIREGMKSRTTDINGNGDNDDDDLEWGEFSDGKSVERNGDSLRPVEPSSGEAANHRLDWKEDVGDGESDEGESGVGDDDGKLVGWVRGCASLFDRKNIHFVPFIVSSGDLITAIGAGMTVQFFPLFFVQMHHLSPAQVSLIFASTPLVTAVVSNRSEILSRSLGSMLTIILLKILAILLLCLMVVTNVTALVVFLFIFRTSTMNSPRPLIRSFLMDHVPKSHRGKWNAVESVAVFTWTGSAAIGGIIVDNYGYTFTYLFTAAIYVIGTLPYLYIYFLMPELCTTKSHSANLNDESGEMGNGENCMLSRENAVALHEAVDGSDLEDDDQSSLVGKSGGGYIAMGGISRRKYDFIDDDESEGDDEDDGDGENGGGSKVAGGVLGDAFSKPAGDIWQMMEMDDGNSREFEIKRRQEQREARGTIKSKGKGKARSREEDEGDGYQLIDATDNSLSVRSHNDLTDEEGEHKEEEDELF